MFPDRKTGAITVAEIKQERVGMCKNGECEGAIIKETETVLAVSASEVLYGGENPTKDIVTCYCCLCGTMYKPEIVCKSAQKK